MNVLIGLLVAAIGSIITTGIYVVIVWRLDRFEKEPIGMLALAFAWGMLPAVIVSVIVETLLPTSAAVGDLLLEAGGAPVVEESAKALALLAFLVFSYRELDNVLDGIVYGAMIGFGFAFTENILYVVSGVAESGLAVGIAILLLRTVIFGLNHALFTGITGAAVGAARLKRETVVRFALVLGGLLLAVTFHAVHNVGTALAESTALASLGVSFLADWGGVLGILVVVVAALRREQEWMANELVEEVAIGTLTAEHYTALTSRGGRQRLLALTLRRDGWTAYRRLNRLYGLCAELAIKKHQLRLMGDEHGNLREIERLRATIRATEAVGATEAAETS